MSNTKGNKDKSNSIEHTGFNKTVVFPDGYKFVHDANTLPKLTGKNVDDTKASFAYIGGLPFKAWVKDISFVINQIEKLNNKPGSIFHSRLDTEKIGSFGWYLKGKEGSLLDQILSKYEEVEFKKITH